MLKKSLSEKSQIKLDEFGLMDFNFEISFKNWNPSNQIPSVLSGFLVLQLFSTTAVSVAP